jgi:tetratricopeptide (TPR) repeat protein
VTISIGVGVSRAQSKQSQQTPPVKGVQQMPPAKGAPATPSKAEEDAYKIVYASRTGNAANQIKLGEDFLKRFPQSRYLAAVYAQLTRAYYQDGPDTKMFRAGDMALALDPDNVSVLSLFAMVLSRRVKSTVADAAMLQKAEAYGRRAIELIPRAPRPEGLDDAAFDRLKNDELAMAHSGLGLVAYQHQKFEEARAELTQAVRLASKADPSDYFVLGGADLQGHYYNDAVAAFEKCATGSTLAEQCKASLDLARKDAASKQGR